MRTPLPPARRTLPVVLALGAVLLVGCAGGSPAAARGDAATPDDTATPVPVEEPTPSEPGGEPIAVDWTDPAVEVALANGWVLRDCEGDAPLLCVHDGGETLGFMEALRTPLDEEVAGVLASDGLEAALRQHVANYHEAFVADRTEGCEDGYRYVEHPTETVELAGAPALRYGFSGITRDGVEVERNVAYATIVGDQLELVVTVANDERSCVHSDTMQELTPAQLLAIEPFLDAVAAGSVLPR